MMSQMSHLAASGGEGEAGDAQRFRDLMTQSEGLLKTNRVLQSYLTRHSGGRAARTGVIVELGDELIEAARARAVLGAPAMTMPQEFAAVQAEVTHLQRDLIETDVAGSKAVADCRAMIGETAMRIAELRRAAYETKRDIVVGGADKTTGKIAAEVVLRHWEASLKARDAMVDKLNLKNAALKAQIARADAKLRQQANASGEHSAVDYHQLRISHTRLSSSLKARNAELLARKATTTRTQQVLNTTKQELNDIMTTNSHLVASIKDREDALLRLTAELGRVEREVAGERRKSQSFAIESSSTGHVPQVMDYVRTKASVRALTLDVASWERKVVIAELALKRTKRQN